jgi:hypothetical protein
MKNLLLLMLMVIASNAHAQIGWAIDQCRKHWGRESRIEHPYLDESHTTTFTAYIFGADSKIEKQVTFDQRLKVDDVWYYTRFEDNNYDEILMPKIWALLARQKGIVWEAHPLLAPAGNRMRYTGKKNGVVLLRAYYEIGHKIGQSIEDIKEAESLHIFLSDDPQD